MMNIFKLLTKSGRQSFVREKLKENLTRSQIAVVASAGVNKLLASTCAGISGQKMADICNTCSDGASLLAVVANAVKDKHLTPAESSAICERVFSLTSHTVNDETIDNLIDRIVTLIP